MILRWQGKGRGISKELAPPPVHLSSRLWNKTVRYRVHPLLVPVWLLLGHGSRADAMVPWRPYALTDPSFCLVSACQP